MFFSMYVIVEMEKEKMPFFSSNVYLGIRTPSDYKMTAPEKVAEGGSHHIGVGRLGNLTPPMF